ncbi:MAG: amino acid permease [Polyangiaceae bacterium]|nr:amino acid permease [Polyangiaceae bacterium]
MIPVAGSAYTYSYATLGEFFAWIIGWDLVLEYAMGASAVAVGWSGYVVSLLRSLGIHIPAQIIGSTGTKYVWYDAELADRVKVALPEGWHPLASVETDLVAAGIDPSTLNTVASVANLPAVVIVALVTGLLIFGVRESATINAIVVVIKLAVILAVIGIGYAFIDTANWTPFIPPNTGKFGEFGLSGIARGAGVIFFAYIGFDAVSTAAQEAKKPQRDMPIGILGSLVICTILYMLMAMVLTGVVPYQRLGAPDPIAVVVDQMGIPWVAILVKFGAIAGLTSVILVLLLAQPRIFFSMSRDGLLPPFFSKLHPRFRTPHKTTMITGAAVAVVAALAPMSLLGELVSIGTLSAFMIVCASVLVLRKRLPDLPRPFRTPWVPVVPILGIAFCLYLMAGLPLDTWLRLLVWLALGFAVYFFYGRKHSRVNDAGKSAEPGVSG